MKKVCWYAHINQVKGEVASFREENLSSLHFLSGCPDLPIVQSKGRQIALLILYK